MSADPDLQQITIQAKTLISAFEKGDLLSVIADEDHVPDSQRQLHPEMSVEELAEPGTAKKLHLLFESKAQISPNSSFSCRSPTSANVKLLTPEMFAGFEGRILRQNTANENGICHNNDQPCVTLNHVEKEKLVNGNSENMEIHEVQDCHCSTEIISQATEKCDGGCAEKKKVVSAPEEIKEAVAECVVNEAVIQDEVADKKILVEEVSIKEDERSEFKEQNRTESETTTTITTTTTTIITSPITIIVTEENNVESTNINSDVSEHSRDEIKQSDEEIVAVAPLTMTSSEDITNNADHVSDHMTNHVTAADENHASTFPVAAAIAAEAAVASTEVTDPDRARQKKHVLIVSAVTQETGFHSALCEYTLKAFTAEGHDVIVTDVTRLMEHAAQDFNAEQEKWLNADLIMFLYHMVLNTHPAALQNWLEKVLTDSSGNVTVGDSSLKRKKGVLVVTTDVQKAEYDNASGPLGDIKTHLAPLQNGVLRNVNIDVLPPQIIFGIGERVEEEEKENLISAWSARLPSIWDETPIAV